MNTNYPLPDWDGEQIIGKELAYSARELIVVMS